MLSERSQAILEAAQRATAPPAGIELPAWCSSLRSSQIEAINQAMTAYQRGIRMVVLDAPTGTGKTLIGEIIRQALDVTGTYLCNSKSLQDQFLADFDTATVLKGRNNYGTLSTNREVRASDCNKSKVSDTQWFCSWCADRIADCPYEVAKNRALASQLAVLNTSYFLTEANGPGKFTGRDFVICDEADTLEHELMRYVSVELTEAVTRKYDLGRPALVTKEDAWLEWVDNVLPEVRRRVPKLDPYELDVRKIREVQSLSNLVSKLQELLRGLREGGWIYVGTRDSDRFSFKPIQVRNYGDRLWRHGRRWLLMSATIGSPEQILDELGWDDNYEFVSVGSGFKVENRRVVVAPVADMSRKANEREQLLRGIENVLARHSGDRVLVHCVSFHLTEWLDTHLRSGAGRRPIFSYRSAHERSHRLAQFAGTRGAVLLAPSFDRGIDLPDDACRVVIVAKVPFPYLGDKQVNARLYAKGGRQWYNAQTARTLVQMTGRATRHADDWSVNYILDRQFDRFYNQNLRLFPKWWRDAVQRGSI